MMVVFLCCWLASAGAHAEEVKLQHKRFVLNANHELAPGNTKADRTVLILHGSLAHNGMELIRYLQKLLQDRGYNSLAINLSLGMNDRHGMYDCKNIQRHRNEDAVEELRVWSDWLRAQGVRRLAVLGHSRGGAQVALFAAEAPPSWIDAYVLLAPATKDNNDAAEYESHTGRPLAPTLRLAQRGVRAGQGATVFHEVGLLSCDKTTATAESFLSYYGDLTKVDAPALLPKIAKPTLVLVAGDDDIVVGLDKKIASLVDGKRVQMKVIEGADHFFRDLNADEVADTIAAFLKAQGF